MRAEKLSGLRGQLCTLLQRQGLGARVAAENLEGLESMGHLQTSSVTMVLGGHKRLDELYLSKISHKIGHRKPG